MGGNTALSYQMMLEEKLMSAMINAEQRGQYAFACAYAKTHLTFLECDLNRFPKLPVLMKTEGEKQNGYITQYFALLELISSTTSAKIKDVRATYGKKGSKDLIK